MIKDKYVNSSLIFFLDQIVVSFTSWIYWLVISRFALPYQIGQATTVYSFAVLLSTVIGLGLEYPLLKRSSTETSHLLGTSLIIELVISSLTIPIVLYVLKILYQEQFYEFSIITILMIFSLSAGFVPRFALYGIFRAKRILIIDSLGVFVKFFTGSILTSMAYGSFAILLSFLLQTIFVCFGYLIVSVRQLGFAIGKVRYTKQIIFEGLVNMPSKLSALLISNLVIVLLAYFGISSSQIGIFYIAQIISIVGGGLMSSISYMVIPASFESRKDLSWDSLRIGISLTALIISFLISSPKFILSLIGTQYTTADLILMILSIGIFPYSITMNAIASFNYSGNSKKILSVGCLQLIVFLTMFLFLVPHYRTLGAALAILLSFSISSILPILWLTKSSIKHILYSGIAILLGWAVGHAIALIANNIVNGLLISISEILISLSITFFIIVMSKNMTIAEIKQLLSSLFKVLR